MNVSDEDGRPYDFNKLVNLILAGLRTRLNADPTGRESTLAELSQMIGPVAAMRFAATLDEGDCTPLDKPAPPCLKKAGNAGS